MSASSVNFSFDNPAGVKDALSFSLSVSDGTTSYTCEVAEPCIPAVLLAGTSATVPGMTSEAVTGAGVVPINGGCASSRFTARWTGKALSGSFYSDEFTLASTVKEVAIKVITVSLENDRRLC